MLIKSQLLSVMSGSLDASVASHNRFGRYLRAKVIPTNPNTAEQGAVRNALASLTGRWLNVLTAGQRAAWATYAANVPTTNRVGDQIFLTGLNQFVRSNVSRIQAGLAVVDDGPTVLTLPTFTPITVTTAAGTPGEFDIAFTNTDDWAGEVGGALLVYTGRQQPATINFNALPFRYSGKIAGAVVPPTSPATITSPYPEEAVIGNVSFLRARIVRADGRLSPVQLVRGVYA